MYVCVHGHAVGMNATTTPRTLQQKTTQTHLHVRRPQHHHRDREPVQLKTVSQQRHGIQRGGPVPQPWVFARQGALRKCLWEEGGAGQSQRQGVG